MRVEGCRVVAGFDDGRAPDIDDDADLELQGGTLLLTYWDDGGAVVFAGERQDDGRYELVARSRPRRAVLRREGAARLVGEWEGKGDRGSLTVDVPRPIDDGATT